METEDKTKEPGNWELYRGIERVEAALHEISKNSVSSAVFAVEKQALHTRIDTLSDQIAVVRAQALAVESRQELYTKEQETQRAKNRQFVTGLIASPLLVLVIVFIVNGGLSIQGN